MTNDELYNNLNDETKKYVSDLLSIFDKLNNNQNDVSRIDNLVFACFLSALKNDSFVSEYFDNFNVKYDDYKIDCDFKNAKDTTSFNELKLFDIFKNIIDYIKFGYYLENKDILINEIKPYQIFDYAINSNDSYLSKLLYDKNYKEIKEHFSNYVYDEYFEFALEHDVNLMDEIKKEIDNCYTFEFDDTSIYISGNDVYVTFNKNVDLNDLIHSVKSNTINDVESFIKGVSLPQTFKLLSLNGIKKIDNKIIEEVILKKNKLDTLLLEIEPLFEEEKYLIKVDKNKTFNKDVQDIFVDDDYTRDYTPYLDKYGFDLTKDDYVKDPCVGRDEDIRRIEQILLYPERDKSIMIVGEAGSGKTALVKGLAYRIKNGQVPEALKHLRIISIDTSTLVAGTKYVGTLEEKMINILDEASLSKDIIIFIDEIHQALGGGKAEGNDNSVSEILKPYIDYGRVRVIGATTTNEYIEYIESDAAFKSRFKKVSIKEPDRRIIYMVLDNLITNYNKLSDKKKIICPKLDLDDEKKRLIINWLIDATSEIHRAYDDKVTNPRLVLDILKEAYAIAAINEKDVVEIEDIATAISLEERLNKSHREEQAQKLIQYDQNEKLKQLIKEEPEIEQKIIRFRGKKI